VSEYTQVDFGGLGQGSAGIMATHRALQGTLDDLERQLEPMVNSWTGDAKEAYFQQKQKWDSASAAMAQILQQMGRAVDEANSNYQAAENSNRGLWNG
jgi:WXG100 family type VII secretion target